MLSGGGGSALAAVAVLAASLVPANVVDADAEVTVVLCSDGALPPAPPPPLAGPCRVGVRAYVAAYSVPGDGEASRDSVLGSLL